MMLHAQAGLLPPASATNMQVPDSTNHMQLTRQYRDQSARGVIAARSHTVS